MGASGPTASGRKQSVRSGVRERKMRTLRNRTLKKLVVPLVKFIGSATYCGTAISTMEECPDTTMRNDSDSAFRLAP